jgi:glycosyltransferase involved in cell wall biosynthesis
MNDSVGARAIELIAWGIALAWSVRSTELIRNLPTLADLSELDWDAALHEGASVAVVVPARDEAKDIAATMDALLMADYRDLLIVGVDDRSTDETGAILDAYAAKACGRMKVIHVEELADGWLGKTFAMQLAVEQTQTEYLLFTDADVLLSPSIVRKAVHYAEMTGVAHLVVVPTMQVKSRGEGIVLGFFQILGMWAARPWRVMDPKAKRDAIGVGAFNMMRRDSLLAIGGLEPQRMVVLEDITLGLRFKAARLPQRVAVAPGQVLVHWASGVRGLVRVMTKNMFSGVNFQPLLMLGACGWIVVFCLAPLAGLAWWGTLAQSLIVMFAMASSYRAMGAVSRIDARYGWLYPLGALAFVYAMLRSMLVALWIGGVRWRGTVYPLRELRQHNSPWQWERAAVAKRRLERLRSGGK